jgi:hypothetical protein
MAAVKKFNTSYTLDTTDVIITGNLTVQGTQTAIESIDTVLKDRIITLNSGETGAGVTLLSSGIEVDRGSLTNVSLIWSEPDLSWAFSNNGTTWTGIVGSSTGLTKLIDDVNPILGANLNTNSHTISSNVGNLKFTGNMQLTYSLVPPVATTGTITFNAAEEGAGQSGLYVTGDASVNEELITKKRAFAFSLIL